MDLSAVIFVALAVAWAVYLVPKALKHHDEVARSRSVERFSATMRTLARRDTTSSTSRGSVGGRVVVTPGRPERTTEVTTKPRAGDVRVVDPLADLTPAQRRARREAARTATRRRRRVLGLLLLGLAAAVTAASLGAVSWWVVAAPGSLIVMWLVACRAMVRGERRRTTLVVRTDDAGVPVDVEEVVDDDVDDEVPTSYDVTRTEEGFDEVGPAAETASLAAADVDPELWEPRPVTLPTYVSKPIAPLRHAKMLHKDERGVWTSGHDTSDSILAQEAREDDAREARAAEASDADEAWADDHRAVGS